VLHERVVLLTISGQQVPHVKEENRAEIEDLGQGFWRIVARYGYMESPNVPQLLASTLGVKPTQTSYYLGRETLIAAKSRGMAHWRKVLFAFILRNSPSATAYFHIPPNRVVELGMQIEI
jgi:KUP system potassium uptake protein